MKQLLIYFTLISFSFILLSNISCANRPEVFQPPAQMTNETDPNATNIGFIAKTQGYDFSKDFIFHEWKNEEAVIKYVPFNFVLWGEWTTSPVWPIKKLVSSKYFDIYVDITEGAQTYKKAITVQDKVYNELTKELEKLYPKIVDIYGEPSNIDGNGKIEIVFHENTNYGMTMNRGGYFYQQNVKKGYRNTGNMDIIYINSYYYILNNMKEFSGGSKQTIIHEFQHDIEAIRQYESLYCYNEALSESTYPVILNSGYAGRDSDFRTERIRNGQYFFDWERGKTIGENYKTSANFMYWLYLHGSGEKIIKDICSSSQHKRIDHISIGEAASKNIPDFVKQNYKTVIYWWYIANFYNNSSGILGYNGKVNINLDLANSSNGKVTLKPYCAVYTTQDVYDKNKNIPNIVSHKLYDSGRNWLLLFNYSDKETTVYINPSITRSIRRSMQNINKEIELYDYVGYINEYENFNGDDDIQPETENIP